MRTAARFGVLGILLAGLLVVGLTAVHVTAADCEFKLGFKTLRDQIPSVVGDCLENEDFNADNGNVEQRTAGGLLVWRKADNWTAFTDGATTWINGPLGLQSRPNAEQFAWETTVGPSPTPTGSGPVMPPGAEPLVKLAVADAAQRAGVDPSAVSVLKVEARQWPDPGLGCPKPGTVYAQVITPGYEILLQAGVQQLSYHTDQARKVELCLQASR